MKNKKMDQEYSFALRPASIEEVGLFYSNDEQDEALGTVGHLRLDFGHGFLPLRSTCYPHNDDQFNTLEFKMLLREFLEAMQDNGPLASLSSMEAYCQKHGGAITEDGQTYGYVWETEQYRFCLRCTPSPFECQGYLYCYDLWQQQIQKNCPVGQVTYASGEQQMFTVVQHYLQTIREELPYRDTTGFRFETLTDDPQVRKAVDDILLDFAGEENPRRACNYGLTEAGKQALRDAADPDSPHTYAWFVLTDCNTLEEQIFRDLTLEKAIQIYQASDCQEKRIGVTKDEIATVDLVRSLDGEQQFFGDYHNLSSFQNDPVISGAVERLQQELEQTPEVQGAMRTCSWTERDLQYQEYSQRMLSAISGLTSYAASLASKGQDDTVGILRELLIDKKYSSWIGVRTNIGEIEENVWYLAAERLIRQNGEQEILDALVQWGTEHNYLKAPAEAVRKEALHLHVNRIFDDPRWVDFVPFNRRYRPEVLQTAHLVTVVNECCQKPGVVTQEQIDASDNGTVAYPCCGRWSPFRVLEQAIQTESAAGQTEEAKGGMHPLHLFRQRSAEGGERPLRPDRGRESTDPPAEHQRQQAAPRG